MLAFVCLALFVSYFKESVKRKAEALGQIVPSVDNSANSREKTNKQKKSPHLHLWFNPSVGSFLIFFKSASSDIFTRVLMSHGE